MQNPTFVFLCDLCPLASWHTPREAAPVVATKSAGYSGRRRIRYVNVRGGIGVRSLRQVVRADRPRHDVPGVRAGRWNSGNPVRFGTPCWQRGTRIRSASGRSITGGIASCCRSSRRRSRGTGRWAGRRSSICRGWRGSWASGKSGSRMRAAIRRRRSRTGPARSASPTPCKTARRRSPPRRPATRPRASRVTLRWRASPAMIFVPRNAAGPKLAQLLVYGACVFSVAGPYDDAYRLCSAACERFGWYNLARRGRRTATVPGAPRVDTRSRVRQSSTTRATAERRRRSGSGIPSLRHEKCPRLSEPPSQGRLLHEQGQKILHLVDIVRRMLVQEDDVSPQAFDAPVLLCVEQVSCGQAASVPRGNAERTRSAGPLICRNPRGSDPAYCRPGRPG